MTVNIVEIIRRSTQGITRPFLCRGDDNWLYYVKGHGAGRAGQADLLQLFLRAIGVVAAGADVASGAASGAALGVPEGVPSARMVIGSRVGGVAEAMAEGVTGMLVDPNNPEELARAKR